MTYQPISPLITSSFIDSCAFDPKYEPETSASTEIFHLSDVRPDLILHIAHSTQKEIDHPNTPLWVKAKANSLLYTIETDLIPEEKTLRANIETVLAGNGKVENIREDARHIFEAQKYGSYFITTDRRILNHAKKLQELCQVNILLPSEFLALTKAKIAEVAD